jgi:hypothetical protein
VRQIIPAAIEVGDHVHIVQKFAKGGDRRYTGTVTDYEDDYVTLDIPALDKIDVHPSLFMPDVLVYKIN